MRQIACQMRFAKQPKFVAVEQTRFFTRLPLNFSGVLPENACNYISWNENGFLKQISVSFVFFWGEFAYSWNEKKITSTFRHFTSFFFNTRSNTRINIHAWFYHLGFHWWIWIWSCNTKCFFPKLTHKRIPKVFFFPCVLVVDLIFFECVICWNVDLLKVHFIKESQTPIAAKMPLKLQNGVKPAISNLNYGKVKSLSATDSTVSCSFFILFCRLIAIFLQSCVNGPLVETIFMNKMY